MKEPPTGWQAYMQGRQNADHVLKELFQLIRFAQAIVYLAAWSAALPALLLLHYRFGSRFFNVVIMISTLVVFRLGLDFFGSRSGWGGSEPSNAAAVATWACGIAFLVHLAWSSVDLYRGVEWHSRSGGMPYPFWRYVPGGSNPMTVERFYEPALVVAAALILREYDDPFWRAVLISGGCLFVMKAIEYDRTRTTVLDQIDQKIEGEAIDELMQERIGDKGRAWRTKGYTGAMTRVEQIKAAGAPDAEALLAESTDTNSDTDR